MRQVRKSITVAALAGLALAAFGAPDRAEAQTSGNIEVLVAPLRPGPGVDDGFAEDVSERVREALEDFSGMAPIDWDDVEDALDRFELDWREMGLIEWRQLAGRLDAGLVMFGTAERSGGGIEVDVRFVDPSSGDELPVEVFSVADDDRKDEAAQRITAGLEEQVAYQRAVVFCQEYLGSGQLEDALNNCNRALGVNPNSARALYYRGRVHMEANDWEAAREDLARVVEENPSNTDALQSLAFTNAQLGNTERAQELYQEYLTFQPDAADVRLNVAYNLASAGAYGEATAILEEGVQRDSTNAALWQYLGNVALAAGTASPGGEEETPSVTGGTSGAVTDTAAVRLAVRAFEKTVELKGDTVPPSVLTNAIAANKELGDLEGALSFSERALEALRSGGPSTGATPADTATGEAPAVPGQGGQSREQLMAQIHSYRADIFEQQGSPDQAIREMDEVLGIDPSYRDGGAYAKRGFMKLKNDDRQGAVADYRQAVEHGFDATAIASQLLATGYNTYFQQRNDYGTAIDMFRTALEFTPQGETARQLHFFTAYAYYQQGTGIDNANEQEACDPARRALNRFQQVLPHLNQAGQYQAGSQAEIRDAVDVQVYRQEQIIRKACQ